MSFKKKAVAFFSEPRFISHIPSEAEYDHALELMNELIEDYDRSRTRKDCAFKFYFPRHKSFNLQTNSTNEHLLVVTVLFLGIFSVSNNDQTILNTQITVPDTANFLLPKATVNAEQLGFPTTIE